MPKLALIKPQGPCPPDGFRYVFPEDGWVCHAWSYNDWIALAKAHLQANNQQVPQELEVIMQDQLCQSLPPGWCNYDNDQRPRASTSLGWGDVLVGIKTFSEWISKGAQFVSQEEADRRALVCSRCYLNVNVTGCSSCQKMVEEVVRGQKTKYDFALKACGVCMCFLRAKVHFPLEILENNATEHSRAVYPQISWCWLNKNSENYKPWGK